VRPLLHLRQRSAQYLEIPLDHYLFCLVLMDTTLVMMT